ncbi:conserved unknown protein [Ectocarpus siliculosus]|uniref:Drug/Metabolite Transporter (DMT) Superfamily n=1 Tax=Ectocarpus siliculosus TaxID=2880 RepID=D7G582_ECTSI|nr:conserved unknown protein [Ectocarpus siliculosus]|eukprot:CBJ27236.1 conserved unknown protein [Ectocarpus siliculosus]
MKDALPQQQVLRNESHEHVPSVEEELDEYMMLREVSGQYPREDEARSYIVKRRQRGLLLSFTAMVFVSLANKVFQKLETIPMYNYPNFLNLFTTFVYIPFSFAYIIPMMRYGDTITPEQTSVPKRVFAVMGALDGVSGIMQIFASTYLGGSLIILLTQAAIPISMVTSKRLTGARYSVSQYTGATVVAAGIVIAIGPSLAVGSSSGGGQELVWSMVLVASCLPMALSSVYKEMALGESELDPIYLNGWVAVFQFLVCIPLAVPAALAGDPAISPLELPKNLWDGWMCYLGYNSVMIGEHPDNCWPDSPLYVTLYLMVNITYNILITLILKYGGANVLFLAMTICVPLGNVIFALPFVPGHQPLHATDILGLIFVMTGLVLYRFGPALHHFFGRIEAGSDRVAKVASSIRGRGSGPPYAAGDHREPLLDLAEEGDQGDRGFYDRRRMEAGRGAQGRRDHTKKVPKPVDDEWEM